MIASLTIDLAAIRRNVTRLARLVAPARFAPVVKANAYGHGLIPVSRALEELVDRFCVYRLEEALELRSAGISRPILVLGPVPAADLARAVAADVAITIWDAGSYADDLARAAQERGAPAAVHIKIETGVGRLGFDARESPAGIAALLDNPDLRVEGIYTHLAAAEELESAFTREQLVRFRSALAPFEDALSARGAIRHAAASAAAMLFPELRLDLVRAGIATYGIWPSPGTRASAPSEIELEAALAYTSTLVVVRDLPTGANVGYGCTFTTSRPSRIGVVPVGYAEGVPRALSNAGSVLVAGSRAPIVGRVCMNMLMVDCTDIPAAHVGSTVTLLGRDGDDAIGTGEWAALADTIDYEIVARLPAEVPRVYVGA